MATRKAKQAKAPAAVETSASIDSQVADFLKSGGNIEQVPDGKSGYVHSQAVKHIKLGNSR